MNLSSLRQWLRAQHSYFVALLILLGSRLIVGLAVLFSSKFVQRVPGDIFTDVTPRWYRYLLRWDAGWYLKIAREGYSYNGNDLTQQPVVFYPLYPALSKIVASVFGISEAAALLTISNISILFTALLFFKLVKDEYGDEIALYATTALCFFPTSLFFSAGYTESLALLLIVTLFLLLKKERYLLASVAAGLTLATRPTGVVLCLPLLFEIWRRRSRNPWRALAKVGVSMILATSGLWLYMIYLWVAFKSPFAFLTDRRAWQAGAATGSDLIGILTLQPFRHLTDVWKFGPDPNTLSSWFFLATLFVIIWFRRWLSRELFVYALGVLLLPYITFSSSVGFVSFTRYVLLAFPLFIIAGRIFQERVWLGFSVIGLSAAMLFMYTAFYAQWYWAG
jgi:Gpi18-like mannosyltransferase